MVIAEWRSVCMILWIKLFIAFLNELKSDTNHILSIQNFMEKFVTYKTQKQ